MSDLPKFTTAQVKDLAKIAREDSASTKPVLLTLQSEPGAYLFHCPGCGCSHKVTTPQWNFNGDMARPTFSPSLLVFGSKRCHLYVKEGKLQFLQDSEHMLAGHTVEMVPY